MNKPLGQVMSKRVKALRVDNTLEEAGRFLIQHSISSAPVVGDDRRVAGLVSKTDLVRHYILGTQEIGSDIDVLEVGPHGVTMELAARAGGPGTRVAEIMTPMAFGLGPDMSTSDAVRLVVDGRLHRVLVMHGEHVIGVVSTLDLIKALSQAA